MTLFVISGPVLASDWLRVDHTYHAVRRAGLGYDRTRGHPSASVQLRAGDSFHERRFLPMRSEQLLLPPVILVIALAVMTLLHFAVPIAQLVIPPWSYAGFLPVAVGMALGAVAAAAFRRHQTPVMPRQQPVRLVIEGVFRWTRNPMYLGMTLMLAGVWIILGSLTPILVIPAFVWIIGRLFIDQEERVLDRTFGAEFQHYRERVRRWI